MQKNKKRVAKINRRASNFTSSTSRQNNTCMYNTI